jgi:outer membrane protein assembly factor BamE (lipoprotein component of BamABCDE complex)
MTRIRISHGIAAIGLALGFAAAHAASGTIVSRQQESLISTGMSESDVLAAIGKPETSAHYGNESGQTFVYRVSGEEELVFDVAFDASGKVLSVGERESFGY